MIFTRRRFLCWAGTVVAVSAVPPFLRAKLTGPLETVSILHTTDLHGNILPTSTYDGIADVGGMARCASRIRQWRAMNPHTLLVDAGDVYQGTEVGYRTRGRIMVDCFNHLDYDAWVLGNHEFDWGEPVVREAIGSSAMPVLTANATFGGKSAWEAGDSPDVARPFLIKEVNGYKIALIGAMTPNMPNWFLPEVLRGFEATDPVPAVRRAVDEAKAAGADAIILVTHMGTRPRMTEDDQANRLFGITEACPEIDAIIGGHTHRNLPNERINGVIYTQANYFGIHVGRLDLVFNADSRKLVHAQPIISHLDGRVPQDPAILSLAKNDLEESERVMSSEVGTIAEELGIENAPGRASGSEKLIGTSILHGLRERGYSVDAALHGLLFQDDPIPPGKKTVEDLWGIIPFENFIVTARFTRDELVTVLEEVYAERTLRSLVGGISAEVSGPRRSPKVERLIDASGADLSGSRRYTIALNSYDAAGGGGRFPKMRDILRQPASELRLLPYQSRAFLIDFVRAKDPVRKADLEGV
ncbi:MAG: bifunctional metallophosphatase/5'-nucleotidase [Opitutales bacterium]|nr:bifunctional metallophosphatase/5'-nucleotidase [Opitutales bacterium]